MLKMSVKTSGQLPSSILGVLGYCYAPICFEHCQYAFSTEAAVLPLVSQLVPSTSVYSVTYRAEWKPAHSCVLANETGRTILVQSGMEPIGLGWVHLADCKRFSCHQCHAADGQFASDFQSGAKPFRSFGSPSAIRQQPLMACRWLWQPSCLCILRALVLLSGGIHSGLDPPCLRDSEATDPRGSLCQPEPVNSASTSTAWC